MPGSDRERRSVSVSVSAVEEQDPLGVRSATAWVVERAGDVSVVPKAAAVTSAIERGVPLTEPAYLAGEACAAVLLAGVASAVPPHAIGVLLNTDH